MENAQQRGAKHHVLVSMQHADLAIADLDRSCNEGAGVGLPQLLG